MSETKNMWITMTIMAWNRINRITIFNFTYDIIIWKDHRENEGENVVQKKIPNFAFTSLKLHISLLLQNEKKNFRRIFTFFKAFLLIPYVKHAAQVRAVEYQWRNVTYAITWLFLLFLFV